jgi:4-hydroxy-tetrahydrodipicolinate reductase
MKLLLVGYGKMGRMVEKAALEAGLSVAGIVDPAYTGKTASGAPVLAGIDKAPAADMAVEFTGPSASAGNSIALAEKGYSVVVGSTGWLDKLPEVTAAVKKAGVNLLWSSNFAIGVAIFYRVVEKAASLVAQFSEYDAAGYEIHHNKKADSPSGTAKTIAGIVTKAMSGRKDAPVYDKLDRPPAANELHFASLRVGSMPGTHGVVFDSPADTIELRHTARNREGLAAGAVRGAQWLAKKPAAGIVYTMEDMLRDFGL